MWSPERKVPRCKCLSREHSFSCSNNLYKHYRTFTDHRPQPKLSLNCKEATDLFLNEDLSPCQRKARLRELFKGRLTSEELVGLALPQIAKIARTVTGRFAYKLFRLQVDSPTSRSFHLHDQSRFAYTI